MKLTTFISVSTILSVGHCVPNPQTLQDSFFVSETKCNGRTYTYEGLAGYGFTPSDFRDKFGETLAGPSSVAFDAGAWEMTALGKYKGIAWTLPDRGWYVTLE